MVDGQEVWRHRQATAKEAAAAAALRRKVPCILSRQTNCLLRTTSVRQVIQIAHINLVGTWLSVQHLAQARAGSSCVCLKNGKQHSQRTHQRVTSMLRLLRALLFDTVDRGRLGFVAKVRLCNSSLHYVLGQAVHHATCFHSVWRMRTASVCPEVHSQDSQSFTDL